MEIIFILTVITIFFLGSVFGSFLNVLISELEPNIFLTEKERKVKKIKTLWFRINRRSACPHCQHKLQAWELVPIFSWIFLKGKCSTCKNKISFRYLGMEIFSGAIFLLLFYYLLKKFSFGAEISTVAILNQTFWLEFIFLIPIISAIILIFSFDWKHKIIPDIIILPAIFYTLILISFNFSILSFDFSSWLDDVWRALAFALPFLAIWFISRGRVMGFADWKLVFFLSLFLKSAPENLLFVFGSFWVGAIYSLPILLLGKKKLKSEVPFGPFIIISFLITWTGILTYSDFVNWLTF